MSDIDFQNGFLCGLATRGLVTNGFSYQRFIELNVSDGYTFKPIILSDSATTVFDTRNDSTVAETYTMPTLLLTDGSEVTLT
jgi:hypothetical protein